MILYKRQPRRTNAHMRIHEQALSQARDAGGEGVTEFCLGRDTGGGLSMSADRVGVPAYTHKG
jgi:hypothetical protein